MQKTELKIDIDEICHQLKKVNPKFKKEDLYEVSEVNRNTVTAWKNEAPRVVQLLLDLSKEWDIRFNLLVLSSSDLFPVIKVLKYFETETKIDCETVIIKN